MRRLLAIACSAFVLLLGATGAFAQGFLPGGSVTVVGTEGFAPDVSAAVDRGVLAGARTAAGALATDYTDVAMTDALQLIGCSTATDVCLLDLADVLGTDRIAFAGRASSGELEFTVFDARVAAPVTRVRFPIGAGTSAERTVEVHAGAYLSGRSVVQVAGEAPGEVTVAGRALGALPALVALAPGEHEVVVAFDDGRRGSARVEVDEVGLLSVEVRPRGRVPRDGGPRALSIAGWTAVGAGVAALGVGGMYGARVSDAESEFENTALQRDAYRIAEGGETDARRANAFFATGGALVVGGVVAVLVDRVGGRDAPTARRATFAFVPERGGAQLGCRLEL